jgi:hypothetical protein
MNFTDANQAKEFFISRIAAQADTESTPLEEIERKMLKWTEVHPIPGIAPEELETIATEFSHQFDDEEWEEKIRGLIQRAYANDLRGGEVSKEAYKAAYDAMGKEDHYILVMIDQAIGSKLKGRFGIF